MEHSTPAKGDLFYTINPDDAMVQCEYIRATPNQTDCHEVQLKEGLYLGVCYKSRSELLTEKPILPDDDKQKFASTY